ncbi:MAG: hypothetical protein AMXMBFR33_39950 [Candidatus Xenobia bacterium]
MGFLRPFILMGALAMLALADQKHFQFQSSEPFDVMWVPYRAGPRKLSVYWNAPEYTDTSSDSGPLAEPHFGISGFARIAAGTLTLKPPGTLTVTWTAKQAAGMDESEFRVYRDTTEGHWELVGGTPDVKRRRITVPISKLGTFTLAPPLPTGDIPLQRTSAGVTSSALQLSDGRPVPDGTPFVAVTFNATPYGVEETRGLILTPDENPALPGIQVGSRGGKLDIKLRPDAKGRLVVYSLYGTAYQKVNID